MRPVPIFWIFAVRTPMVNTRTLSIDESVHAQLQRVDHLYVVVAGGKPGGGARWALTGIDKVEIGRGATRAVRRDGSTLRVEVPDPWMSASHLRFERERAHWLAADAGSRNGILVNGAKQDRAIVADHDVIEAGRSFFMLRTSEASAEPALELPVQPTAGGLVTLDPALARSFAELARIAASPVPVLVGGPTGSGKERVAFGIHTMSGRKGAFVPVNCGALPAGLIESEEHSQTAIANGGPVVALAGRGSGSAAGFSGCLTRAFKHIGLADRRIKNLRGGRGTWAWSEPGTVVTGFH